MSRLRVLTDDQWAAIESLVPSSKGRRGKPLRDSRQVIDGIIYRYRTGIPWRDLPADFGPWQTVWKRHRRYAREGLWDRLLTSLVAQADAAGLVDWTVSVDSTVVRAHQHATNTTRLTGGLCRITRIWPTSQLIMGSGGLVAGCPRRSTSWSTARAGR
jgi:transposase